MTASNIPSKDNSSKIQELVTEEDRQLSENIHLIIERLLENSSSSSNELKRVALDSLKDILRSSTSSMTSVPKPMKFLYKYLPLLRSIYVHKELRQSNVDDIMNTKLNSVPSTSELIVSVVLDDHCLALCADILSVMCMAYGEEGQNETLYFRLACDRLMVESQDISYWGHEYMRHLSMEIMNEFDTTRGEGPLQEVIMTDATNHEKLIMKGSENEISSENYPKVPLKRPLIEVNLLNSVALRILPYFIAHNAEADAVDLCLELNLLEPFLFDIIDVNNYKRMCLYLSQFCSFEEDSAVRIQILRFVINVYEKVGDWPRAFQMVLRLGDESRIWSLFTKCGKNDPLLQKQLAFILARCRIGCFPEEFIVGMEASQITELNMILSLGWFGKQFKLLAGSEFNVEEPKIPEDVYKSHLVEGTGLFGGSGGGSRFSSLLAAATGQTTSFGTDNWKPQLANVFVNGLLNLGHQLETHCFTNDSDLLQNNKEVRLSCAIATLGWVHQWDIEGGTAAFDKYLSSEDKYIRAGALLGLGTLSSGIRDESEPALAFLLDALQSGMADGPLQSDDAASVGLVISCLLGLGLAYSGSRRVDVRDTLIGYFAYSTDGALPLNIFAAMALGLVCCGSVDGDALATFLQFFMEVPTSILYKNRGMARLAFMAFGLLFVGVSDSDTDHPIETVLETIRVIEHPELQETLLFIVRMMSQVASGNVLFVQECLQLFEDPQSKSNLDDGSDLGEKSSSNISDSAKDDSSRKPSSNPMVDSDIVPADSIEEKHNATTGSDIIHTGPADKQLFGIIGIAATVLSEEIGSEMSLRLFQHCLSYLSAPLRCMVPLAIGMLYASHPSARVLDILSKCSHDSDSRLSQMSILALGLVGLGTNQSKLSAILRDLWKFYGKEPSGNHNFWIRIAHGLIGASKGLVSGSSLFCDRLLVDRTALGSMLLFFTVLMDETMIIDRFPQMMFLLTPIFSPRILATVLPVETRSADLSVFDAETGLLKLKSVDVRVGHPVDVVGQAGRPKTITGFQTHLTPVLLAFDERAEIASEAYIPLSEVLEGFVILKRNPNYYEDVI